MRIPDGRVSELFEEQRCQQVPTSAILTCFVFLFVSFVVLLAMLLEETWFRIKEKEFALREPGAALQSAG